ncbi:MAG: hypothetical protein HKO94_02600, partial [Flavobacteriaceae bacterium]|nr:hypothetical protein [Flavobacteriaceae bacterium]
MSLRDFLKECNDRGVFKRLSIYIVSSWVVLQVLVAIYSPLGIPEISVTYLILVLLIGFPIYIYANWRSQEHLILTDPDDIQLEEEVLKVKRKQFKSMYFKSLTLISIISLVAVVIIIKNRFISENFLPELIETDKIAVLNFDNDTGDEELDIVGKMAADWVIDGITNYGAGEVISSDVVDDYLSMLSTQVSPKKRNDVFTTFFKTEKLIKGSYVIQDDKMVFRCIIQDGKGQNITAFEPIECQKDNALSCIEELKQKVVVYLGLTEDRSLGIERKPPDFEAYQKFLLSKDNYDDVDLYLRLLNEAIALDSTYFEPQLLRVQHYYNSGDFKVADSLIKSFSQENRLNKLSDRQKVLLNFCEALLTGKNNRVYQNFKYEFDITPKHLETNSTYMVLSLQYVNKPEILEDAFEKLPMEDLNLEDCVFCSFRYFTMGMAYNELGEYDKTIALLEPVINIIEATYLKRTLSRAYIETGREDKLDKLLQDLDLSDRLEDKYTISLHAGLTHLVNGESNKANEFFESVI